MSEDLTFFDGESWTGGGGNKFGLTFQQIVIMHINRCVMNGSVEWKGGYWETRLQGDVATKVYVPDSRATYENSVIQLHALLESYLEKDILEKDKEIQDKIKKLKEEYKDTENLEVYFQRRVELFIEWFQILIREAKDLNFFQELEVESYEG